MDIQDYVINDRARWHLQRGLSSLLKDLTEDRRSDENYVYEEIGRLAGLAFRAAERNYPWPGANITKLVRPVAEKYGLVVSYATWNRGVYDDGSEGCPFAYIYLRNDAPTETMQALCRELDIGFTDHETTKSGLIVVGGEAFGGIWQQFDYLRD